MPIKKSTAGSGIPFGENAGRPANPQPGQPFFNGEASRLELYTSSTGWQNITQETPAVIGVSGVYRESYPQNTLTINGTNFGSGAIAYAVGSNGVEVQALTTSIVSVVEISATFSGLSKLYEPYDVKVVNPSNLYGILYDTIQVDNTPTWILQSGTLGTFVEQEPLSISTGALDDENQTIQYSVSSGSLPGGLSLNGSTGVISGIPSDVIPNTNYSFTLNAFDGQNNSYRDFSIYVSDRGPSWNTGYSLPKFSRGVSYSTTLLASDDNGIASYSLFSGSLPPGLTLNQSNGTISGTPSDSTTKTFVIRATDVGGNYSDRQFTITNNGPTWATDSSLYLNKGGTYQLVATDDDGLSPTYTKVSGTFPSGVTMDQSGLLSISTNAVSGSFLVSIEAMDSTGQSSVKDITIDVSSVTGGVLYQTPGTYSWTVPQGVYSVSAVAVGAGGGGGSTTDGSGGGGGGGLGWKNGISVTPGTSYSVFVAGTSLDTNDGQTSYFISTADVAGLGGKAGVSLSSGSGGLGGSFVGSGGGNGGIGGSGSSADAVDGVIEGGGGGGAGGYSGDGGRGESSPNTSTIRSTAGVGGAGGGGGGCDGSGYGGGGVGIYGEGVNGQVGPNYSSYTYNGGSNGQNGGLVPLGSVGSEKGGNGGNYGGGGGGGDSTIGGYGGQGAVRIIWGDNRAFPATNVGKDFNGFVETIV